MNESGNKPNLIDLYRQYNNFGRELGMDFTIIRPGEIEYRLTIEEKHLSTPRAAHGGVIAALMDGLLGVAGLSVVYEEGKVLSTVEFKINFLNPALLHDKLIGRAKVDQRGKRILVISGDIIVANRDNIVIAKALGTFNAYPAEKAGILLANSD